MGISEKINDIIDRRKGQGAYEGKGHLQVVLNKITFLERIKQILIDYNNFRNRAFAQIQNKKGEYYEFSMEDPAFEQKIISATPDDAIITVERALDKLKELKVRFERDTINISVIGRAGQGKSRLLQSISGVDNAIIPADSGGDCTGAKSVICNSSEPLCAYINCYNEKELLEQVQRYLDSLNYGEILGSVSQIPAIDTNRIAEKELTNKQESYYERLLAYVNHYNEYSALIGTTRQVSAKDDIRQYVAQYLLDGTKVYKFLAVKEVQICTPFNYADAGKIMLIDTIGLGDTSIGLREKMLDTLVNDSDAAIMLRRPDKERDGVREEDNDLYDMINERMAGRDIEKWLFYVLNIYADNSKTGENLYEQLMRKFGKTLKAAFIKKIDCADKNAVEEKLIIPMLDNLSSNLTDVDNSLLRVANTLLINSYNEFFALGERVKSLSDSNFVKALDAGGLFDTLYEDELNLARKLEELNLQYKNHTVKCEDIENEVKKSLVTITDECPTYDEILNNLKDGKTHPATLYEKMSDQYRALISDKFDEINKETVVALQEGLKHSIIEVLRADDGGRLNIVPLNTENSAPDNIEWLDAFITQKLTEFPIVKEAFLDILNYRLNIEGMLEYYVNTSLEYLDPEEKKKFTRIDFSSVESKEEEAELIEQALLAAARDVAHTLVNMIQDLLQIPYNSFYARIRKLRERIIYSKHGGRELKNLYRQFATQIWRERFAMVATKQVTMGELNAICDKFVNNRIKSQFIVKLENQ